MLPLPDDALVVRGGLNSVELLEIATGVTIDEAGNLHGLSVNCAPGRTVAELAAGRPNRQVGVTTVGAIRAAGGEVQPDTTRGNPYHCLVGGISAQVAQELFNPLVLNPNRVR